MHIVETDDKLFCLMYGMSGSGKTHLAAPYCQWKPNKPVILIDADKGTATLRAKELQDIENLFVISFDKFSDLDEIYECCKTNTPERWIKSVPELKGLLTEPIGCIIWDTWTEAQWIMSSKLRIDKGIAGKGLNYRANLELQHWGMITDLNKMSVQAFKELPIECIFIMQAQLKEDSHTGAILKGPAIHGKLMTELPAMFTTIIYTYASPTGEFSATTLPKMGWMAKVRGVVGKDIKNPTFKALFN